MKTEDILKADGWREYPNQFKDGPRCFYKRFAATPCAHNDDKPGIQVELSVSRYRPDVAESFELEIVGAIHDGTWVVLKNYSLPSDVKEVLRRIPALVALWEFARTPTPHERT